MKNLVIAVLASIVITGMNFWQYGSASDRPLIEFAMTIVIFVMITAYEEWLRVRRMKRFWTKRFEKMLDEMQNRPH